MARILYDDGLVNSTSISLTDEDDNALTPIIGDINNLDAGPARFLLDDATQRVNLGFNSTGSGDDPTAVAVVASLVAANDDTDPTAALTRTTTRVVGIGDPVDVFGTDIALGVRGERASYPTVLPVSGGLNVYRMAFSSPISTGTVLFDIERVLFLRNWALPKAVDAAWSLRYVDLSQTERADSGEAFVTLRRRLREISVRFSNRREAEDVLPAEHGLLRVLRAAGTSRPIMLIPRDIGGDIDKEILVLGLVTSDAQIDHVRASRYSVPTLTVLEL